MKTITLQGERHKFEHLYKAITLEDKDNDLIPYEVETRVYVIDTLSTRDTNWDTISNEEFMTLAEEDGRVYTLEGFQEAFNSEEISSLVDVIRFITQPLNL